MRRIGAVGASAACGSLATTLTSSSFPSLLPTLVSSSSSALVSSLSTTMMTVTQCRFQSSSSSTNTNEHASSTTTGGGPASSSAPLKGPTTSYALATLSGFVHDIQLGSVGDDNILQFVLTTTVCDPQQASTLRDGLRNGTLSGDENNGGAASSALDATLNSNRTGAGASARMPLSARMSSAAGGGGARAGAFGTIATNAVNNEKFSTGATTTTAAAGGRFGNTKAPIPESPAEAAKNEAMMRQNHLVTTKEQFVIRCYGGEDELAVLQEALMEGTFARVLGNFRMNKQRDAPLSPRSRSSVSAATEAAFPMKAFPFVRVELGDASGIALASVAGGVGRAAVAAKSFRGRVNSATYNTTHSLQRMGSVTVISRNPQSK